MMEDNIRLVREALSIALESGAQKARVTLCRSIEDLVATLNGEVDKVTHCEDSSLSFALFADGRFGSFSTNKLDPDSLKDFLKKAVGIVRMMAPDPCRDLPSPERCCTTARKGDELDLIDAEYGDMTPERRKRIALDASVFGGKKDGRFRIISEESEYSDSRYETVIVDSQGLQCVHIENSFDYGVEITIEAEGEKYSGYSWDSSSRLSRLKAREAGLRAVEKAAAMVGSEPDRSRKTNMVVDSEVASKMVSPLLNALNAYSIQQNNSFLNGSLGSKVFPDGVNIVDVPHINGQTCSKLFDSEGVATRECHIIENGTVKQYFINTYMGAKLKMSPTVEEATRPKVLPWPEGGLDAEAIMGLCGDGIYVTDFNGGNCNTSTGDFSYGIEGFLFRDGKIVKPVSGMLVTGNFITLWNNLVAAGEDARPCLEKLIPTLAFSGVDFNG